MATIILPGMGADSSMYPTEYFGRINDTSFIEWPEYKAENTIEEVAERLIELHKMNSEMVVGGSSLGGMVAIQIAKIVGIKKVILIGSATSPQFINPILKKLSGLSEITPVQLIQTLAGKIALTGNHELFSMFKRADSRFIKAMCKALFSWEGIGDFQGEVCQIHGQLDKVIFPPKDNVEIIIGGGHLISMTHGDLVANFINNNKNIHYRDRNGHR